MFSMSLTATLSCQLKQMSITKASAPSTPADDVTVPPPNLPARNGLSKPINPTGKQPPQRCPAAKHDKNNSSSPPHEELDVSLHSPGNAHSRLFVSAAVMMISRQWECGLWQRGSPQVVSSVVQLQAGFLSDSTKIKGKTLTAEQFILRRLRDFMKAQQIQSQRQCFGLNCLSQLTTQKTLSAGTIHSIKVTCKQTFKKCKNQGSFYNKMYYNV